MERLEIIFEREKETKNTMKFCESVAEGDPEMVGCLYVQKWALKNINAPARLKITIEAAE